MPYVCMWSMLRYVCIYVSMYICIYVSMYVFFFVFLNQSHQPCVPSMCISSDYVCTSWATCPFLWWLQHQFALSLAKLFYPLLSVSRNLLFAWRLPSNVLWLHSISLFAIDASGLNETRHRPGRANSHMQAHSSISSWATGCVLPQVDEEIVEIVHTIVHTIPPFIFQKVVVHHCYSHSKH